MRQIGETARRKDTERSVDSKGEGDREEKQQGGRTQTGETAMAKETERSVASKGEGDRQEKQQGEGDKQEKQQGDRKEDAESTTIAYNEPKCEFESPSSNPRNDEAEGNVSQHHNN
ncbi:hypothetical protein Pcinc_003427 [Petrolisthes cinctipes]|uniref:Uncharacterized protein n=1 Tax=Petrolisthes cinctipes TaxID=88211 RepID=A0AAE1GHT0_PETCI|nr:hypothetical protein Pcinc_003427 [Petrolisthes cinctipes]